MDTVTQALLGGAVAYVVAGKSAPRKAVLWGAGIAVLPDLDVFIPHTDDLAAMTLHRSWSHSWLVQTLLAPLLAWVGRHIDTHFSYKQWLLLIWLALITHSGLDALTVYGTQLFWPFMPPPVSGGSVFIIDPFYSIPLLAGFLAMALLPTKHLSQKLMHYSFIFSCLYLLWGLSIQQLLSYQTRHMLAEQHIEYQQMQISATAMNTLLWRILVVSDDKYYEGFYSLFDHKLASLQSYPRGNELLEIVKTLPSYQRLAWFTNGLFKLEKHQQQIIATDLRMGMDPVYFFRFHLATDNQGHITPVAPTQVSMPSSRKDGMRWVWQRIWQPATTSADYHHHLLTD